MSPSLDNKDMFECHSDAFERGTKVLNSKESIVGQYLANTLKPLRFYSAVHAGPGKFFSRE